MIYKGVNPNVDSYSAFFDNQKLSKTSLEELMVKEEVTDLYICGIATDVCVGKLKVCLLKISILSSSIQLQLLFMQLSWVSEPAW